MTDIDKARAELVEALADALTAVIGDAPGPYPPRVAEDVTVALDAYLDAREAKRTADVDEALAALSLSGARVRARTRRAAAEGADVDAPAPVEAAADGPDVWIHPRDISPPTTAAYQWERKGHVHYVSASRLAALESTLAEARRLSTHWAEVAAAAQGELASVTRERDAVIAANTVIHDSLTEAESDRDAAFARGVEAAAMVCLDLMPPPDDGSNDELNITGQVCHELHERIRALASAPPGSVREADGRPQGDPMSVTIEGPDLGRIVAHYVAHMSGWPAGTKATVTFTMVIPETGEPLARAVVTRVGESP